MEKLSEKEKDLLRYLQRCVYGFIGKAAERETFDLMAKEMKMTAEWAMPGEAVSEPEFSIEGDRCVASVTVGSFPAKRVYQVVVCH